MSPARRGKLGWSLGALVALAVLSIVYFSGVLPWGKAKEERKPLCWVSPQNPNYIKEAPGKDSEGNDLVPVYPTAPGAKPSGPAVAPSAAPAPAARKERKIKYWVDPMDPNYVRDKPGKAPCGMDLVPVYEEEGGAAAAPGVIAVSPATLQSMGVRTAKVEVRPLAHDTWTVGLVTFNERSLAVLNTKVNGWVDRLYINATGDPVQKGQPLLSIYSPDLVSAQDEYLLALRNLKNLEKSPYPELVDGARRLAEASRRRLEYFDINASQIEELKNTGRVKKHLVLASPARGIVTKRMVTQGQMVQAGMPLLEVADLSTVWVDADIYQYELPWIKAGQAVEMSLQYLPGETFAGRIDYIYPYLKENTRTARVRLRFPNPQLHLKPEMFAQVQIKSPVTREAVVVPTEAVLDTGLKQHVFIALGGGRFEPREVKLGVYGDGNQYREVLSGLQGGEEVVTSAQFLLDSESRFREAIQMMLPPQGTPEAGKEAAPQAMPGTKMEAPKEAAPPAAPMPPGHKH
jgi:Cu(I)/Ag(I) efflux system membrane fusion protein/cobalt-zinc-cadmium efflux system membrane fusion protein